MRVIFFDTETTGNGEHDRLCQLAVKVRGENAPLVNATYKPPLPISIESMAIHHITEKMVMERPLFQNAPEYAQIKELFESDDVIAVAHNIAFDIDMLAREGIAVRCSVCTYKLARTLDPEGAIPNYKLQYLRNFLGIELDAPAHDAWGDVLVLEALFERLLAKMAEKIGSEAAALDEMIEISAQPFLIPTFGFGKYNGRRIADVAQEDPGYLQWLLAQKKQNPAGEEDWIYTLEKYAGK